MWCLLLTFPELLVGGGLLVPCFLPGPPVIKQLMQIVTMVPGQGGAVSVSVIPLQLMIQPVHPKGDQSWVFIALGEAH